MCPNPVTKRIRASQKEDHQVLQDKDNVTVQTGEQAQVRSLIVKGWLNR